LPRVLRSVPGPVQAPQDLTLILGALGIRADECLLIEVNRPSMLRCGNAEVECDASIVVLVPAGVPRNIIALLHDEIALRSLAYGGQVGWRLITGRELPSVRA
jgi:hypothetical protein